MNQPRESQFIRCYLFNSIGNAARNGIKSAASGKCEREI